MDSRQILDGSALDWKKVAALGVAFAVSGNFSGWNYGLAIGGWGGMLAAAAATGFLYLCLTLCLAELAAALPQGSGFDFYVREGLGTSWANLCGWSLAAALSMASGLVATFAGAYLSSLAHLQGWGVKAGLFAVMVAIQLRGARETAIVTMLAGAISVFVLIGFCLFIVLYFDPLNLLSAAGDGRVLLPHGLNGCWQCLPFAVVLYLGVEQVAQAAAETSDPGRTVPKALAVSLGITVPLGLVVLILTTAGTGVEQLTNTDDPLFTAASAHAGTIGSTFVTRAVGVGALISLFATFFSLTYAGSRQIFFLARAGALPAALAHTGRRHVPVRATAVLLSIGLAAAAFPADAVLVVFIFLIGVAYVLLFAAFISLRRRRPALSRPFRVAGGWVLPLAGILLTILVMTACYRQQGRVLSYTVAFLGLLLLGQLLWRRRHSRWPAG